MSSGRCSVVVGSDGHYGFSSVGRKSSAPPPTTAASVFDWRSKNPKREEARKGRRRSKKKKEKKKKGKKKALARKEKMPTITKLYSMEEVSKHNTNDDCWIVVNGNVYDVTMYLDEHPGGDDVLLAATGKDATEDFEDAGHSKTARDLMQEYFIGELDTTTLISTPIAELEIFQKDKSSSDFSSKLMSKAVQYWAFPAAIIGISVVAAILCTRKK
ncbi:cytochrome b5 isoform X2 [Ananas comosus]|uniref:Cytochrome b5 isoform X2 n=1 Tax=Ananas comosus TaxID=4615 RepID=A0A6P5F6U6_ANACO|nr:cytochrome b5 isoform X2 [Ananas comosus]